MQQKRLGFLLSILLALALMFPHALFAKQIHYKHTSTAGAQQFSYRWQIKDKTYDLSFKIETSAFASMPATQPAFSNALMQREIEVALLKYGKTIDPRSGRVNVKGNQGRIEYGVTSRSQIDGEIIMKKLKQLSKDARESYLSANFYTDYATKLGVSAVKHDHAKYAEMSVKPLIVVVDAIKAMQQNVNDPREFIQLALSWMQSIPYDTLQDRASSNGAGFVSPKDLLLQNQGDCDSKATFLAALMRAYSESLRQKMVLLPKHALLAIAIRAMPEDKTIMHDGIQYVLLEAAGPGYFAIGEVAKRTMRGIRNRQFSVEAM
jgi:hypothetical protein